MQQSQLPQAGWFSTGSPQSDYRGADIASIPASAIMFPPSASGSHQQQSTLLPQNGDLSTTDLWPQPQDFRQSFPSGDHLQFDEPALCAACLNFLVEWTEGPLCDPCMHLTLIGDFQPILHEWANISSNPHHEVPNSAPASFQSFPRVESTDYGYETSACQLVPLVGDVPSIAPEFYLDEMPVLQGVEMSISSDDNHTSPLLFDDDRPSLSAPDLSHLTGSISLFEKQKKSACDTCRRRKVRCLRKGPDGVCPPRPPAQRSIGTVEIPPSNGPPRRCRPCSRSSLKCDYRTPCNRCVALNRVDRCKPPTRRSPGQGKQLRGSRAKAARRNSDSHEASGSIHHCNSPFGSGRSDDPAHLGDTWSAA